jgi:hypothetical protein
MLQKKDQEVKDQKDYIATRKRADEVPVNTTRDAAIKRLRSKGHLRDGD